ncbi:sporulation/spore germination protein [Lusitaniella coriacea]|uniref:sporulation/spore germination protein n=1 Tax=Lusitaniella coriacea TaxID=1983105 RepID=UPI003CF13887
MQDIKDYFAQFGTLFSPSAATEAKVSPRRLTYLLAGSLIVSLSGCQFSTPNSLSVLSPDAQVATQLTSTKVETESETETTQKADVPVANAQIFFPDGNCETLVPEKIAVPVGTSLDSAIAKLMEKSVGNGLDVAGYRVDVDSANGLATVDFRLSPDSPRQFISLSQCEQFALFGSLRKTLTENSQWSVKDVRFTEQGQELTF